VIDLLLGKDSGEVLLERSELKVLASDTRVDILKTLKSRNYTVSELSTKLNHSKSTLHEHISRLVDANLVEKADNYTNKWVYYRLSRRGKELFVDRTKRIVVIISTIFLVVGLMQLVFFATTPQLTGQFNSRLIVPAADRPLASVNEVKDNTLAKEVIQKDSSEDKAATDVDSVFPFESPDPEAELGAGETEGKAITDFTTEPMIEETPYYLFGGIGFIVAAYLMFHYYHFGGGNSAIAKLEKKK